METSIITTPMEADTHPTSTKRCTKCGKELPATEFNKRRASADGLQQWCKQCYKTLHTARSKKPQTTPPDHELSIFDKMQDREVIAEIKDRINHLRSHGWTFDGHLEYTQIRTVKL